MKIVILTFAKDKVNSDSINRLTEEMSAKGHEVLRVRYLDCMMGIERGEPKIYHKGIELTNVGAVVPWIIQGEFSYGLSVLRHFEKMGVWVLNTAEGFDNACDKWRSMQLLAGAGLTTPDTFMAYRSQQLHRHIDGMPSAESVIKLTHGMRGNGVLLARDRATAKAISATLEANSGEYILQEYVSESSGVDIRAYVAGGRVLAAMERRSSGDFRANLSQGGAGIVKILSKQEENLVLKVMDALKLRVAGVDIIQSKRGPLVIEANTSAGFGIEKVTSVNIASIIVDYIEQNAKRRHKKDRVGA